MKKRFTLIFIVLVAVSFLGCGAKEKLEDKAAEAIAEKVIEESSGGDVDIDGDKVTVKGEDGEEAIFGSTDWPTSELATNIPEFKGGKIVAVMEANDSLIISIEEANGKDFENYLNKIKETYTEQSYDMKTEESITYSASNDKGVSVTIIYGADKKLNISLIKTAE